MLDKQPDPKTGAITIGAYEAKTKFSELIARTEKGESFVITKNGREVARLAPPRTVDRESARRAAARIRELAARIDLGDITWAEIKSLRDEGRP
jgi:prevent-host-death family protein